MATPASLVHFRPLVLGLGVTACGALCFATGACGGDDTPSQSLPTSGSAGTAGTTSTMGGMSPGGGAPAAGGAGGAIAAGASAGGAAGSAGGAGAAGAAGTGGNAGGSGGAAGASGAGGSGGGAPLGGTATRPQLADSDAANHAVLKYLEKFGVVTAPQADPWDPTAGIGDVSALTPTYTVDATGAYKTVQSAIDAAKAGAAGSTDRIAIEVKPGTYREVVCVPSDAPPITLFSKSADASLTKIVFNNYSGKAKAADMPANPCTAGSGATTYGTTGSATFSAFAKAFQAKNLTIENDTDETGITEAVQAVALLTQGDRQIYENVRLLGNQDTFFAKTPAVDTIMRVYVTKSFIQGDTDFIFGRATLVVDQSEIRFVSSRQGSKGYAIVPSTDARNPYGILVNKCTFTADDATTASTIHLGRAWDESGKDVATYMTLVASGVYPNGQALVRESTLGAHIRAADPWAEAATTKRPFSSVAGALPANRLYELGNTGPGAAAK